MAKKLPTVVLDGVDQLLLRVEGQFNLEMDKRILDISGDFAKQMDVAAQKVFKAMAVGATTQGIVGQPVIGRYLNAPSFLKPYIPADESWKPLNKKYLKRKRRLMGSRDLRGNKISTMNMWQYSGDLKRIFQRNSTTLTRMSGNTFRYKSTYNSSTGMFGSRRVDGRKKEDTLFRTIPAVGGNTGKNSLGYDFSYVGSNLNVKYTDKHKLAGNFAKPNNIARMNRYIGFNVFNGLSKYMDAFFNGGQAPRVEDYIDSQYGGKAVYKNSGLNRTLNSKGFYTRNLTISNKLTYYAQGKRMRRGLIQPYMLYYANKVMRPLAQRLIQGK